MPLYDYGCEDCGPFRSWQSMDRATSPAACTECGKASPRLVSAPNLGRMDGGMRGALQRCDKTSDSPSVIRRNDLRKLGRPLHDHHAHGGRSPSRRWMIGH